jgi:NAD+ diphosphatase
MQVNLIIKFTTRYQFYNNPTPVVGAIVQHIEKEGDTPKVVLVQGIGWPKDWFGLVTGFLEYGEDPKVAVCREIHEELGLPLESVQNMGLVGIYPFKRMNQVIMVYHCLVKGKIVLNTNELAAYKEVDEDKVVPWEFGTGMAMKEWLLKRKQGKQSKL